MKIKPIPNAYPCREDEASSGRGGVNIKPFAQRRNRGVALLIVLGMLVLLAVIVVAFVTSVTTDLGDSKAYEAQINTRMLADSAVDLIIGEIRQASTSSNQAWISQPGLIRTFDTQGNTTAYKLYSASQMVVNGAFDPNAGGDLPSGSTWLNQPNLYTDLNSPIVSSGSYIFPIIDGNGMLNITVGGSSVLTYSSSGSLPDIEGFATNPTQVGVNYNTSAAVSATNNPVPMPVQWLYMLKDGSLIAPSAVGSSKDVTFNGTIVPTGTNPIVARIAFWTDDETCKVNINTACEGTFWDTPVGNSQPMVASPGSPDPSGNPAYSFNPNQTFEWDLAQRQGDQNEYTRYPGHPAQTCLSTVLGAAYKKFVTGSNSSAELTGTARAAMVEFFNQITPRVTGSEAGGTDNSSKGGTWRAGGSGVSGSDASIANGTPINPDTDRLYATVDELFYNQPIGINNLRSYNGYQAVSGGTSSQVLTPQLLEKTRFFLTANSKAPEQNIFNLPRICMWPITKTKVTLDNPDTSSPAVTATMSPFDKVIAFCATVSGTSNSLANKVPFYLSRYDPTSGTNDWGTTNQNLYAYLQTLTGQSMPGFGAGTFASKYGTDQNQILTEMLDYIRCTNLCDNSLGSGTSYTPIEALTPSNPAWLGISKRGQVVPLTPGNGTRGFGRIATISEMAIVLVKEDNRINTAANTVATETGSSSSIYISGGAYSGTWNFKTPQANTSNVLLKETVPNTVYTPPTPHAPPATDYSPLPGPPPSNGSTTNGYDPRTQTRMQVVLMPHLFAAMCGYGVLSNDIRLHFTNLQGIQIKDKNGNVITPFPSGTTQPDMYQTGELNQPDSGEYHVGGPMGVKSLVAAGTLEGRSAAVPTQGSPLDSLYPNAEVVVDGTSPPYTSGSAAIGDMVTVSGSFGVTIEGPASTGTATIQQFTFVFPPNTTMPIPNLASGGRLFTETGSNAANPTYSGSNTMGTSTAGHMLKVSGGNSRIDSNGDRYYQYIQPGDVIRSIPLAGTPTGAPVGIQGDYRLVAATGTVDGSYFAPLKQPTAFGTTVLTGSTTFFTGTQQLSCGWHAFSPLNYPGGMISRGQLYGNLNSGTFVFPPYANNTNNAPYIPEGVDGVVNSLGNPGDWENGPGLVVDGAYINKPDEGEARHQELNGALWVASDVAPYIGTPWNMENDVAQVGSFFSPNKQISSPVMFGGLSTGVIRHLPWQTLLFRPAESYLPGGNNHPGAAVAGGGGLGPGDGHLPYPPYSVLPDHLLLDLFWMPVVEPYPISEPFATAGKINLNYQIAPFTYITRKTALTAVLKSVKITAINPMQLLFDGTTLYNSTWKIGGTYLYSGTGVDVARNNGVGVSVRRSIDITDTLNQIDMLRFAINKPFITASEICDVPLIPADSPLTGPIGSSVPYNINSSITATTPDQFYKILTKFWYGDPTNTSNNTSSAPQFGHRATGDNSLEHPYSLIYPRLTTKSNVYTVHVRVQTLKKASTTPANVFKDGQDQVLGELRGSFVIERYLDPAGAGFYPGGNTSLPQVTMSTPGAQLGPYRFRVVSSKQFGQ